MTTTRTRPAAQTAPDRTNWPDPDPPIGRPPKVAQGRSGGVAYATAEQLASLSGYIERITAAASETGWHAPNMVISFGEVEDETIVVGIRWVNGAYVAEIR